MNAHTTTATPDLSIPEQLKRTAPVKAGTIQVEEDLNKEVLEGKVATKH